MEKNYKNYIRRLKYSLTGVFVCALFCMSFAKAESGYRTAYSTERLDSFLKKVESAYHVSFVYDATQINKAMIIEAPVKLVSINTDLEPLKSKGIIYSIVGKQVILKRAPAKETKTDVIIRGRIRTKTDGLVSFAGARFF